MALMSDILNMDNQLWRSVTPKSVPPPKWSPGPILAEILPKLVPSDQIWQPKSVRGGTLLAAKISPGGPILAGGPKFS